MPKEIHQQQSLSGLLAAELEDTRRLLEILIKEQKTLGSADPDKITVISAEKITHLKKIEKHNANRERFLTSQGLSSGITGMETVAQSLPNGALIAKQWQELQSLAGKLKRQNDINGGIVALTQRHITLALDILTGRANTSPTYGPGGQTNRDGNKSQRLAKA